MTHKVSLLALFSHFRKKKKKKDVTFFFPLRGDIVGQAKKSFQKLVKTRTRK